MAVNKVILVGNVGKDPEVRYLEGGTAVCSFSLATSETYRNKDGERVSTTEWHNIVMWRGLAEIAEKYVKKGSQLFIEGKIRTRSYDKDGIKRYTTEIVADNMQMLGRKADGAQSQPGAGGQATSASSVSGSASPKDATPGSATPDSAAPGDAAPRDMTPGSAGPENPSASDKNFTDIDNDPANDDLPF